MYRPTLDKLIAVDESLLLWKERLVFCLYIPSLGSSFSVSARNLDTPIISKYTRVRLTTTGYDQLLPEEVRGFTKTEKVTLHLVLPLLDKGSHIFMDNWFSSPTLFLYPYHQSTLATGTVRVNWIPVALLPPHMPRQQRFGYRCAI